MIGQFIKFNLKIFPLYFMVALMQFIGLIMWDNETISYVRGTLGAIAQVTFFLFIPNVIYAIKYRQEKGVLIGLSSMLPLIPIPYIIIAVIMKIVYF
ncbi:hypothetical protein [Priestia koreensis]|uniref:hypothetical protein n=1 Tax=Priestia koreensis TaxID=284581 RepID=UPI001F5898A7|nr:hypothetical protein [Priestia koreensis]UNL87480.1 hypothetical protein IE339_24495 [Priestia koreensis]